MFYQSKMSHSVCKNIPVRGKTVRVKTPAIENIISLANSLSKDEYKDLCFELIRNCNSRDERNVLKNYISELNKKKEVVQSRIGDNIGTGIVSGDQCKDRPSTSKMYREISQTAFPNVALIYRGDLFEKSKQLVLGVEKLDIGVTHTKGPGTTAVVNEQGKLVFWAMIKHPNVCKYYTPITGLTKSILSEGITFDMATDLFKTLAAKKTIIGSAVKDDIFCLGIKEPSEIGLTLFDIQSVFRDKNDQPMSLSFLSKHFLGYDRQSQAGKHCSIRDARLTLMMYKRWERFLKVHPNMTKFICPQMNEQRKVYQRPKYAAGTFREKCSCGAIEEQKYKKSTIFDTISNVKNFNANMLEQWDYWPGQNNATAKETGWE